jgi:23S rRNA pseudouridine2605 synthase
VRLNRYLSLCGLGSRRGCEALISEGQVSINGSYSRSLGTKVEDDDEVRVNGKIVRPSKGVVLALNKPKGYVCTRGDTHDRLTIYDLLPSKFQALHHVGRLDKDSEGLLLMTNRGDLSHRLMHPSEGVEKEYEVVVDKPIDPETLFPKLVKGLMTPEGYAKAERVWSGGSEYRLHLVLKQGLKRQIRQMLYFLGFEVERLIRIRIGWLQIKGLPKGSWKELTEPEVERFFTEFKAPAIGAKKPRQRAKVAVDKVDTPEVERKAVVRKPTAKSRETAVGSKKAEGGAPKKRGATVRTFDSNFSKHASAPRKTAGGERSGKGAGRSEAGKGRKATGSRSGSTGPRRGGPRSGGRG